MLDVDFDAIVPKETVQFKSWICLFCDQKIIRKPYVKKFLLLVYSTEGYETIWNKIDHLCLWQIFFYRSMATAKNNLHIICIEVIICPVFRWYIFSLSLSFTDFISSITEWLTAVLKFLKRFLLGRFQSFCMSLESTSISYHLIIALKNDKFVSPIKEVIK